MVMYDRAMDVVGILEINNDKMSNFIDTPSVGVWAYDSVKKAINSGVFNGLDETTIAPKATFTYAEATMATRNLIIEAGLINE